MFPWYAVLKIFAFTACWIIVGSGSNEGSEYGRSPVATNLTQSVEPATGTSCTLIPPALYQPIFVAIANGAAAEVMVLAQKPNLTVVSADWACPASARKISSMVGSVLFIVHL